MAQIAVSYCRILVAVIVGSIILAPAMAKEALSKDQGLLLGLVSTPQASAAVRQAREVVDRKGGGSRVVLKKFYSCYCCKEMDYYAFVPVVPACSKTPELYPVLFLLHGAYGSYRDWKLHAEKELCKLVAKYRIIIITPEGGSFGWYADSAVLKNNRIESYFINELIPDVEQNFPTNGLKSIAGLSMGGHGAFELCLSHPGEFVSVSSMSGILDITRHKNNWRLPKVFGPYGKNARVWDDHSVLKLLERPGERRYVRGLPMLITVSTEDPYALEDNRLVNEQLDRMNVAHRYKESPGGHDWTYWLSQLPVHVAFHAKELEKAGNKYSLPARTR